MIDELAQRRVEPAAGANDPLDRISVRDYVREVEIGAFKSERGVTQRIRFNVVLEVSRHAASVSDDVDQVISYDMIVEAIDGILATGRINLLETCAERVAEKCLADPRAVRALVRIEKLDRIPGALGVEIERNRLPETVRKVAPVTTGAAEEPRGPSPTVLVLPPEALDAATSAEWRRALRAFDGPVIAFVAPGVLLDAANERASVLRLGEVERRRLALLAYEQAAWAFGGDGRDVAVVETRTELRHAVKTAAPVVWAPFKLMNEASDAGTDLDTLVEVLVGEVEASRVAAAGGLTPPKIKDGVRAIAMGDPGAFLRDCGGNSGD